MILRARPVRFALALLPLASMLTACSGGSTASRQQSAHLAAPLCDFPAPTGLAATDGTGCKQIQITWNEVEGATGYVLMRSMTERREDATEIYRGANRGVLEQNLSDGTVRYYWVAATDIAGDSGHESAREVGHAAASLAAPGSMSASDSQQCQNIVITWGAVPDATRYEVLEYIANDISRANVIATVQANQPRSVSRNVGTNQTWHYWVRAYNPCGGPGPAAHDTGHHCCPGQNPPCTN